MKKRILVTGSKGFIGKNLISTLDEEYTVIGIDRESSSNVDILSTGNFPSVDAVVHLAGKSGVRESIKSPKSYWRDNVEATRHLLRAYPNTRVLVASSSSAYEPWRNPYASSKAAIESIPHLNAVFMRFHTVYAEKSRENMLVSKIINNNLNYITEHYRDFIHVDDICSAIKILIENTYKGVIDIGSGISTYVPDLLSTPVPIEVGKDSEREITKANIKKMKSFGWNLTHTSVKDDIDSYRKKTQENDKSSLL